jgi:hypothetical protein
MIEYTESNYLLCEGTRRVECMQRHVLDESARYSGLRAYYATVHAAIHGWAGQTPQCLDKGMNPHV